MRRKVWVLYQTVSNIPSAKEETERRTSDNNHTKIKRMKNRINSPEFAYTHAICLLALTGALLLSMVFGIVCNAKTNLFNDGRLLHVDEGTLIHTEGYPK